LLEIDTLTCWSAHNFNPQNVSTVVTNFENKDPRERRWNRWEDNIKMDLRQVGREKCGPMAQERDNTIPGSVGVNNLLISCVNAFPVQ
jgi:hypothetical protein